MNNEKTEERTAKTEVIEYGLELDEARHPMLVEERAYASDTDVFCTPKAVDNFCRKSLKLDRRNEEFLYLMVLDVKGHVKGIFELGHGSQSQCIIGLKEMFTRTLLCSGSSIIVWHNHPSGGSSPSMQDEGMAGRIAESANLLDIKLLDFIIIGDDYYSFAEHKEIDD